MDSNSTIEHSLSAHTPLISAWGLITFPLLHRFLVTGQAGF